MTDGPITERGDPRDRISNQGEARHVTPGPDTEAQSSVEEQADSRQPPTTGPADRASVRSSASTGHPPEAHANTIRKALELLHPAYHEDVLPRALASLAALVQETQTLRAEATKWEDEFVAADDERERLRERVCTLEAALRDIDALESDGGTYDVIWDGVRQWTPAEPDTPAPTDNRVAYMCAHDHGWWMRPNVAPRGCPVCNTITFDLTVDGWQANLHPERVGADVPAPTEGGDVT